MGHILYFAYGVDLARAEFLRRWPGADWLGVAKLEDHRFFITSAGRVNVKAEPGAAVWGVLWLVPAVSLETFDAALAAAGVGFEVTTRRVVSPAGPKIEATLFYSPETKAGVTEKEHANAVLAGARESGLPAVYIRELEAGMARGKDSH